MSTQQISYSTRLRLKCGCTPNAAVIVCVSSSLTTDEVPFIYATVVNETYNTQACTTGNYWSYLLSFDDTQLSGTLISSGIRGVVCKDCLTEWIEAQIVELCVEDTDSIDLTLGDCLSADVSISEDPGNIIEIRDDGLFAEAGGEGGDDWHILGNSDIVDGTNFLGTLNNVAVDIRVNNERAGRFQPASAGFPGESAPDAIFGYSGNAIQTSGGGNSILGGGKLGGENIIYSFPFNIASFNVISGGHSNYLDGGPNTDANFIGGGSQNHITAGINCVIVGGNNSFLTDERYDFIGGGQGHSIVNLAWYSFIGGGEGHSIDFSGGSGIVSGADHIIDADNWGLPEVALSQNFIGGGRTNHIENCDASSVVGGLSNVVGSTEGRTFYSFIGGGSENYINNTDDVTETSKHNSIVGGRLNYIENAEGSVVLGGFQLSLATNSAGYQAFDPAGVDTSTNTDLRAFTNIFYIGDADLWIGNVTNTAAALKFFEPNADLDFSSTHFSSFEAQTQAANIEYVLPAAAGVAGQVLTIQSVVGTTVTLEWA